MTLNRTIYEIQFQGHMYRIVSYPNSLMQLYRHKKGKKTEKYKWKFILALNGTLIHDAKGAGVELEKLHATKPIDTL